MFRGSPDLSADQLASVAAAMGGDFTADTQQSVTQFFFTMPKQDLDMALHIESLRMQSLLATDALWDHERGAFEQEVARDLSNPEYLSTPSCCRQCSVERLTSAIAIVYIRAGSLAAPIVMHFLQVFIGIFALPLLKHK